VPTAEDRQARATKIFLGKLTIDELRILRGIVVRRENGIEPTDAEFAYFGQLKKKTGLTNIE
jgi:hypothetical protein